MTDRLLPLRPGPGGPVISRAPARPHAGPADDGAALLRMTGEATLNALFLHPASAEALGQVLELGARLVGFLMGGEAALWQLAAGFGVDHFAATHSLHVATYAVAIGQKLHLSEAFLRKLAAGALLHDLGQALLPPALLVQPEPLSTEEWQLMRQHPRLAVDLLSTAHPLDEVTRWAILGHHERLDGSGYPLGLTAAELPLSARLVILANAYDAAISHRVYRPALAPAEALDVIGRTPAVADAELLDALREVMAGAPSSVVRSVGCP